MVTQQTVVMNSWSALTLSWDLQVSSQDHHSRTLEGPYQTTDLHPPWPPILMSSTVSHQESSLPSWADRRAGWSLLEWEQGCEVVEATVPEIS